MELKSKMKKYALLIFSLFLLLPALDASAQQQQPSSKGQQPRQPKPQPVDRNKLPLAQRPDLSLDDVNTAIAVDKRSIVMMAALNVAGYDYEPGNRPLTALRRQVREDLKNTNPDLLRRIRNHFLAHSSGKKDASAVAPYLSLALSMTEPPAFTIDVAADRLPEDVRAITDFALLLEEFYSATGFSKLLPKYIAEYVKAAQNYPQAAGLALG
ncbi:MAG: hypothetical protein ACREXT_14485, partial [Gammaproteobacteria bacterium]